ncbi:MAG: WS/DGAT/MGAT family O-acyltransferase [Solirubrobacteraceae bacterium]|nr:MAG: wax ester/triacylglycerol synthase family O-acyltransferase [Solirubrobacterales bacterium]
MAQRHLDRLSAIDASFLHQEGTNSHMHVGALTIFEGPAPPYEAFADSLRARLHLVPRYRQRLAHPPLETGRPLWADDPNFNLEYHVRHTALPAPGDEPQLLILAARIFSQRLDRSKPLWEMWLIEGLTGDRFALITKTHHALVDGIAGVDVAQVIFDVSREPQAVESPDIAWEPAPEPSSAELVAAGVKGMVRASVGLAGKALTAAGRPATAVEKAREAAEGVGEIVWAGLNPAPETPFNVEIGPHRRYTVVRGALSDYKEVKDAFGCTLNDVVLAVVAGSLGDFLRARGIRTEGLELRALVPVSIRPQDQRNQLGNQLAAMRGPLPVYVKDPVTRLRLVKQAMDGLKESKQAVGAEVLAGVQNFAPPTILAQASRLNFSTRLFNLIVTNVPGPQFPLYVLGRELEDVFPVAFLPENHALAIAIMSYNGKLNFGLLADYDTLPDLELIADGIERSLTALLRIARKDANKPARPSRSTAARAAQRKRRAAAREAAGDGAGGSRAGRSGSSSKRSSVSSAGRGQSGGNDAS